MVRRGMLLAAMTAAVWLVGASNTAYAGGGTGWIFRPSVASYARYEPQKAAKYAWRRQLLYGGQATGHAIYAYRYSHVRLGGHSGHPYTGHSHYYRREYTYSVPTGY